MAGKKRCPICGDEIDAEAAKCPQCGEWIVDKSSPLRKQENQTPTDRETSSNDDAGTSYSSGDLIVDLLKGCIKIVIPLLVLHFTIPSEDRMKEAVIEDVVECEQDKLSPFASLLGEDFSTLASIGISLSAEENFNKHNSLDVKRSWFWNTVKIINTNNPEGETVGFVFLFMTFPFVGEEDYIMPNQE